MLDFLTDESGGAMKTNDLDFFSFGIPLSNTDAPNEYPTEAMRFVSAHLRPSIKRNAA